MRRMARMVPVSGRRAVRDAAIVGVCDAFQAVIDEEFASKKASGLSSAEVELNAYRVEDVEDIAGCAAGSSTSRVV